MRWNKKRDILIVFVIFIVLLGIVLYFFLETNTKHKTVDETHVPKEQDLEGLIQGKVQELGFSLPGTTSTQDEEVNQKIAKQKLPEIEKKADDSGIVHTNEVVSEKLWKLEYSLNNMDQQYGFDIPAIIVEFGNDNPIQLYKNTGLKTQTILVTDRIQSIGEIKSYDDVVKPDFRVHKTYLSVVSDKDIDSIREYLGSFAIHEISIVDDLIYFSLLSDFDTDFHQPIKLRLRAHNVEMRPQKIYQFFDQSDYFQFSNDNFSRLVSFKLNTSFAPTDLVLEICAHPQFCEELRVENY